MMQANGVSGDAAKKEAVGPRARRIAAILSAALAPTMLDVQDDSASHAHHAGMRGHPTGGETHFDVLVTSARFDGMSRVQRHRLVHDLLKDEFASGLHALSLHLEAVDRG